MSDGHMQQAAGPTDLPFSFCRRYRVLLESVSADTASVAYEPPIKPAVLAELQRHLDREIMLVPVDSAAFEQRLSSLLDRGPDDAAERIIEDLGDSGDLSELMAQIPATGDLLETVEEAPVVRLVNAVLTQAVRDGASDVHLEPFESRLAVRFRIDGMLREVLSPPRGLAAVLAARIKIMARLDIAERRLPQDGRISLRVSGRSVDVRVSTIPAGHGERVVLRLLDKDGGNLDLAGLGMEASMRDDLARLISNPHGVLLVTGPTGSGKSTTLYSLLGRLNDNTRNVLTVEDPIEYYIDGIGQTQVNRKVDMSFARGLRAILRQDPDVVMVGEIRDLETAEVCIQASLTGHLVMSTLHTNTAVGAVTRLRDMGVEPFLLSSSLTGVVAQRLVRMLCTHCRREVPDAGGGADLKWLGMSSAAASVYEADGCDHCGGTGYRGRTGVFELVAMDAPLRALVHDNAPEVELEAHARTATQSLLADGRRLVETGITSVAEVRRVTHVG
jgi:general secretion pathway protein E